MNRATITHEASLPWCYYDTRHGKASSTAPCRVGGNVLGVVYGTHCQQVKKVADEFSLVGGINLAGMYKKYTIGTITNP